MSEKLYPCDWCGTPTANLREGDSDPQTGYVSSEVWCGCETRGNRLVEVDGKSVKGRWNCLCVTCGGMFLDGDGVRLAYVDHSGVRFRHQDYRECEGVLRHRRTCKEVENGERD